MKYIFNKFILLGLTFFLGSNLNSIIAIASEKDYEKDKKDFVDNKAKYQVLDNDFYILGPGDTLSIKFVGVDELSGTFFIMRDGNIQLPLLGTRSINGLTLDDARQKLIELYKEDLIRPEIDLSLLQARPIRVSLIGEVQRPGSYTLNKGESSRVLRSESSGTSISGYKTVVDAIQKAGGLTFDADITKLVLYRKLPGEDNQFKKTNLDLLNMIRTGNQVNNPILFDGDSIRVDKHSGIINKLETIPNNLSPETIKIHVIGEVNAPGMYEIDAKTQISQAILIAGGPNSWRHKDKIQLLRVNRNGTVDVKKISFNKVGLTKRSNSISLRNGDIIRVKKNFFGKSTDALGTFLPPIRDIYSLYGVYKLIE